MLRHLLTSLSPSPRLASTLKEDRWGTRVRVEGGERGGEMQAGQHEGSWIPHLQLSDGPEPQAPSAP